MTIAAEIEQTYGVGAECDGILNPELYNAAPFRVVWLLREAWFDGAWRMLKDEGIYSRIGASPTLHPMVYVTFSIFHGFPRWRAMDYIRDDPSMAEVLRSIAYVNVKKCPGDTTSHLPEIYSWFKKGEDIIRRQLLECRPHIVIGCRPYMRDVFAWYSDPSTPVEAGLVRYVSRSDTPLLIEASHPSCRISREDYVDAIISVIESAARRRPNKAPEPTTLLVTPRAEPRVAPSRVVAHL